MSTLDGLPVDRVELNYPLYGSWYAEATLTSGEEAPTGIATLSVGDLDVLGTVIEGGLDAPSRPHVVVVGAPGWDTELVRPLSYRSDSGVRLATVLTDLATLAGETIEQPAGATLGSHWAVSASSPRAVVRLRDVLAALIRQGHVLPWRHDPDGVTRFGARAGVESSSFAIEISRNAGLGWRRLGVEDPAVFLPGNTYKETTIKRLVLREREDKREATIWQ